MSSTKKLNGSGLWISAKVKSSWVQTKPQDFCMTCAFKPLRSCFAVGLSGQGLLTVDCSTGGRSSSIIFSCRWKFLASVLETNSSVQNKTFFLLIYISNPKPSCHLLSIRCSFVIHVLGKPQQSWLWWGRTAQLSSFIWLKMVQGDLYTTLERRS